MPLLFFIIARFCLLNFSGLQYVPIVLFQIIFSMKGILGLPTLNMILLWAIAITYIFKHLNSERKCDSRSNISLNSSTRPISPASEVLGSSNSQQPPRSPFQLSKSLIPPSLLYPGPSASSVLTASATSPMTLPILPQLQPQFPNSFPTLSLQPPSQPLSIIGCNSPFLSPSGISPSPWYQGNYHLHLFVLIFNFVCF